MSYHGEFSYRVLSQAKFNASIGSDKVSLSSCKAPLLPFHAASAQEFIAKGARRSMSSHQDSDLNTLVKPRDSSRLSDGYARSRDLQLLMQIASILAVSPLKRLPQAVDRCEGPEAVTT